MLKQNPHKGKLMQELQIYLNLVCGLDEPLLEHDLC